uniref:Uncharacterized protein n=1 Tax=Rhizophora mucronata TaxID=61149 RepID=A0A2P2Q7I5_RHIMU
MLYQIYNCIDLQTVLFMTAIQSILSKHENQMSTHHMSTIVHHNTIFIVHTGFLSCKPNDHDPK